MLAGTQELKIVERRKLLFERFTESISSPKTVYSWQFYLHSFMRHTLMAIPLSPPSEDDDPKTKKKFNMAKVTPCEYHYELLIDFFSPEQIQEMITHYVLHLKNPKHPLSPKKKGLRALSLENYIQPLQQFCWVNGKKGIDWDVIRSFKGEHIKAVQDREYYDDEIRKALAKADERGRVVIRMQRQTGVRRGAEPVVNIGDLEPRLIEGIGKMYKMIIYRGTPDEYFTFGHPEFSAEVDSYLEFRMRCGEICPRFGTDHYHKDKFFKATDKHLDPAAPLIREEFDRYDKLAARLPKRLKDSSISDIIVDAVVAAGVRPAKLPEGQDRHDVMATHGLRKAFKKKCRQAKVDPITLEYLMGHKNGNPREGITKLMMTYDPADEKEALDEFLKAVEHLALDESFKLKKDNAELQQELSNAAPKTVVADLQIKNKALMDRLEEQDKQHKQDIAEIKELLRDPKKLAQLMSEDDES